MDKPKVESVNKWAEVKAYYGKYFPEYFKTQLDDKSVEFLYAKLVKLRETMSTFYFLNPALKNKYDRLRGQTESLLKRKPSE